MTTQRKNCDIAKNIFSNCFSLKLKNKHLEERYEKNLLEKNSTIYVFIAFLTVTTLTGIVIIVSNNNKDVRYSDLEKNKALIFGFMCSFLLVLDYIFICLHFKFPRVKVVLFYVTAANLPLNLGFLRCYVKMLLSADVFCNYTNMLDAFGFFFSFAYFLLVDSNFIRMISATTPFTCVGILFFYFKSTEASSYYIIINFGSAMMFQAINMYLMCRLLKISFYYHEKYNHQMNWLYDILNNWKCGLIIYNASKQKFKFANEYLLKYDKFHLSTDENCMVSNSSISQNKSFTFQVSKYDNNSRKSLSSRRVFYPEDDSGSSRSHTIIINNNEDSKKARQPSNSSGENSNLNLNPNSNLNSQKTHSSKVVKKVFDHYCFFMELAEVNPMIPEEIRNHFPNSNFYEIMELFKEYYCDKKGEEDLFRDFLFLGYLSLDEKNETKIFEVHIHAISSLDDIYFEFLFNDVTLTKRLEEKRLADKAMLLGKISHEFKNPLIVVSEVVNQINELYDNLSEEGEFNAEGPEIQKKLNFIDNLSQYMMMLVKDFEVISKIENNSNMDLIESEVDLDDFLYEVDEIVNTLIKKKDDRQSTKFIVENFTNLSFIKIDCVRFKQILINLLSNSVKFTEKGKIELKVELVHADAEILASIDSEGRATNIKLNQDDRDYETNKLIDFKDNTFQNKSNSKQQYVKVSVIDTGNGLPSHIIDSINKQTELEIKKDISIGNALGTGYGLSIVQNLCSLLKSKLSVKRNNPKGTIFYFYLSQENYIFKSSSPIKQLQENEEIDFNLSKSSNMSIREENIEINFLEPIDSRKYRSMKKPLKKLNSYDTKVNSTIMIENNLYSRPRLQLSDVSNKSYKIHTFQNADSSEMNIQNTNSTVRKKFDIILPKQFFFNASNPNASIKNDINLNFNNYNNFNCFEQKHPCVITSYTRKSPSLFKNRIRFGEADDLRNLDDKSQPKRKYLSERFAEVKKNEKTHDAHYPLCNYENYSQESKIFKERELETKVIKKQKTSELKLTDKICENSNLIHPNESPDPFELKLHTFKIKSEGGDVGKRVIRILIVDDEYIIRSAIKRAISKLTKQLLVNVDVVLIEASDGLECLLALYLAKNSNIQINAIISDETMPVISGSNCSKIIQNLIESGKIGSTIMYISTALTTTNDFTMYSSVVRKIFPKPLEKSNIREIFDQFDLKEN